MGAQAVRQYLTGTTSYMPSTRAMAEFSPSALRDVLRWRRMGAGWQAVAANLGCSVDMARKTFDPDYVPLHAPAQPLVPPKAQGATGQVAVRRGTYRYDALQVLEHGTLSRADLGERLAIRQLDFHRMIDGLVAGGFVAKRPIPGRTFEFSITAAGVAELARIEAEPSRSKEPVAAHARRAIGLQARRERANAVLATLKAGPRQSSAVAAIADLSPVIASEVLQSLRVAGLIEGRPCGFGHASEWTLTDAGRARLASLAVVAHG